MNQIIINNNKKTLKSKHKWMHDVCIGKINVGIPTIIPISCYNLL